MSDEEKYLLWQMMQEAQEAEGMWDTLESQLMEDAGLKWVEGGPKYTSEEIDRLLQIYVDELSKRYSAVPRSAVEKKRRELEAATTGGEWVEMTEEEKYGRMSEAEKQEYDIAKKIRERELLALEGKLPISPAMTADLERQEKELGTALSQRLGPGWETSTPGIQQKARFGEQRGLLEEEARRGLISQAEAMGQSRRALESQLKGERAGMYSTYPSSHLQLAGLYGGMMQPYGSARQAKAQERAAYYGMLGTLLGSGIGAGGYFAGRGWG